MPLLLHLHPSLKRKHSDGLVSVSPSCQLLMSWSCSQRATGSKRLSSCCFQSESFSFNERPQRHPFIAVFFMEPHPVDAPCWLWTIWTVVNHNWLFHEGHVCSDFCPKNVSVSVSETFSVHQSARTRGGDVARRPVGGSLMTVKCHQRKVQWRIYSLKSQSLWMCR